MSRRERQPSVGKVVMPTEANIKQGRGNAAKSYARIQRELKRVSASMASVAARKPPAVKQTPARPPVPKAGKGSTGGKRSR